MTSISDDSGWDDIRRAVRIRLKNEGLDVPVGANWEDMLGLLVDRSIKGEACDMLEALTCVELSATAGTSVRERRVVQLRAELRRLNEQQDVLNPSDPEYQRYLRNRRAVDHVITPEGTFSIAFGEENIGPNAARLQLASKDRAEKGRAYAQAVETELELLDERRPDELRADLDWDHGGARLAFIARLKATGMTRMRIAELLGYAPEGTDRRDRAHAQDRVAGSKRVQDFLRHFFSKLQKKTSTDDLS